MDDDESLLQNFAAEFDSIDCPNWINFDKENYEPRYNQYHDDLLSAR